MRNRHDGSVPLRLVHAPKMQAATARDVRFFLSRQYCLDVSRQTTIRRATETTENGFRSLQWTCNAPHSGLLRLRQ